MGRSNDMSVWLIRLKKDKPILLSSKRKLKSNIIIYISLNSTLQCNLMEGPFIYKVTGAPWDLWGSSQKHLQSFGGGLEIKILKANGRAKGKRMCLKEQQICQSNCLDFTWDFMLNKYQCL